MVRVRLLGIGLLLCLPILACTISQPMELDTTTTQVAADVFATQMGEVGQ